MHQIKMFSNNDWGSLQTAINDWLSAHTHIKVTSTNFTSSVGTIFYTILYTE